MKEFFIEGLQQFFNYSGFANCEWGNLIMIVVGLIFITLAITK